MRRWHTIGLISIVAALPLLMAQSTGFPSRPRFQAVGVGAAAGAAGTITGGATLNLIATAVQVNGVSLLPAIFAEKTADTSRASTITLAADPHLTWSGLAVNSVYEIDLNYGVEAIGGTTDFKWTIDWGGSFAWTPAYINCGGYYAGITTGGGTTLRGRMAIQSISDGWLTTGYVFTASAERWQANIRCVMRTPASFAAGSGTGTVVWSQGTTNASNLTLRRGSSVSLRRMS